MATFRQQHAPGDYRTEHPPARSTGNWRWLIWLALGLLALWGLFGRRDQRPMMDQSNTREPARMPYNSP